MRFLYPLLLCIPLALVLDWGLEASATWVFLTSALAIVPLSALMGKATEELAAHTGPTVGGLLNASLGNAAELIITILALRAGLVDLVKASITGSIIGNLLLVLGAALLAGGARFPVQRFNRQATGVSSAMMALSVAALVLPAIFVQLHPAEAMARRVALSEAVAAVLIVVYLASLYFTLRTHVDYVAGAESEAAREDAPHWSVRRSLLLLLLATAGVALMSELLVGATEAAAHGLGLSQLFVGIIIVPLIGNAAEHASAIWMAAKNKVDLALGIAVGSSTQVALFVAPVLVFIALLMGRPMDFVFTPLEVLAVAAATGVVTIIAQDGESNWLEGVQLLALYMILGATFYFY
ncbi:MAG TPA: calcium/proton exchanger [Longimicrobiales bacterium]|nr:calcium/proton exchanger [Longimicrobiales bacterium]